MKVEIAGAQTGKTALWSLGFRPFFLGATLAAIASMGLWMAIYQFGIEVPMTGITVFQWHAHEMIYGYGMAVIAGFLLTAVSNWTDLPTANGAPLAALFALWCGARLAFMGGTRWMPVAAICDMLFSLLLLAALLHPLVRAKEWGQIGVVAKVVLLGLGNGLFYLGFWQYAANGVYWSIYGGLYLVVGLILTLGRRIIPHFIARDVAEDVTLFNARWLDLASMAVFLVFFIAELFVGDAVLTAWTAAGLFVIGTVRTIGWHTPGLWKNPLLWSLYLALWFINIGFLLMALSFFGWVTKFIAVHALAFGGIGTVTMGMMARVSLGHTGRDVTRAPSLVFWALALLVLGAVARVGLPLAQPQLYAQWIGVAQLLWIAAFGLFGALFLPLWLRPSLDE